MRLLDDDLSVNREASSSELGECQCPYFSRFWSSSILFTPSQAVFSWHVYRWELRVREEDRKGWTRRVDSGEKKDGEARHAARVSERREERDKESVSLLSFSLSFSDRLASTSVSRLAGAYPGSDVSRRRSYELICGNQASHLPLSPGLARTDPNPCARLRNPNTPPTRGKNWLFAELLKRSSRAVLASACR